MLLKWKRRLATKPDESGRTPLHYTNVLAIARLILEHDSSSGYIADSEGSLPIHIAASKGKLDIIRTILEKCPDCDSSCDASGRTFFLVAVQMDRNTIVKYVCTNPKLRTILNMRDCNGDTALHMAIQNGSWPMFCSLFRNKDVNLNSVNRQGQTPLDVAFMRETDILNFEQVIYISSSFFFIYMQSSHRQFIDDFCYLFVVLNLSNFDALDCALRFGLP